MTKLKKGILILACSFALKAYSASPHSWKRFVEEQKYRELENLLRAQDAAFRLEDSSTLHFRRTLLLAVLNARTGDVSSSQNWLAKAEKILNANERFYNPQDYMILWDSFELTKADLLRLKNSVGTPK